jgi:hypothetical protein
VTLAILVPQAQQVRQELQDQPPRLRSALQLQELPLPSPTLVLRPLLSLTLFSCQAQPAQLEQQVQLALLALPRQSQSEQSHKERPLPSPTLAQVQRLFLTSYLLRETRGTQEILGQQEALDQLAQRVLPPPSP